MKKIIGAVLQFFLFLFAFTIGSFAHPFNLHWGITVTTPTTTRYFVADGLILMVVIFALILLIEVLKHRTIFLKKPKVILYNLRRPVAFLIDVYHLLLPL